MIRGTFIAIEGNRITKTKLKA